MLDLFFRAPWGELYGFFGRGEPTLALQLLALNTVFFVLFIFRRMRGAHAMRMETATTVQSLLIFANALIMFQDYVDLPHF